MRVTSRARQAVPAIISPIRADPSPATITTPAPKLARASSSVCLGGPTTTAKAISDNLRLFTNRADIELVRWLRSVRGLASVRSSSAPASFPYRLCRENCCELAGLCHEFARSFHRLRWMNAAMEHVGILSGSCVCYRSRCLPICRRTVVTLGRTFGQSGKAAQCFSHPRSAIDGGYHHVNHREGSMEVTAGL